MIKTLLKIVGVGALGAAIFKVGDLWGITKSSVEFAQREDKVNDPLDVRFISDIHVVTDADGTTSVTYDKYEPNQES